MNGRKPLAIAAGVVLLGAATTWGLGVSVLASKPDAARSELPMAPPGRQHGSSRTVVRAAWGEGPGEFGLLTDGEAFGPQSLTVDDRERVYVLDSVNSRVVRFTGGAPDAEFALPGDDFEDVAVSRDRLAALRRDGDRAVVIIDTLTGESTTIPLAPGVPDVYRLLIHDGDLIVECPSADGRTYHTIGSVAGEAAPEVEQCPPRAESGLPLPSGDVLEAALVGRNDIAIDVTGADKTSKARIRAHSDRAVNAIVDATSDLKGNLYVTWAVDSTTTGEGRDGRLVVARYSPNGEPTGRMETGDSYTPEPFRKIAVSEAGEVYQLAPDMDGISVLHWTLEP